jgi:gamma-glutamyltranspeptidase/glutathione hydrolase
MVASSQNLATRAGLSMLERGGNAVDAALAAAICLTVVEPCSNGLGSDAFALLWSGGALHGLNGSGPAPDATDADALRAAGLGAVPALGWAPVTVPGAVGLWEELSRRFGALPWKELFGPAIEYAEEGFPVSPVVARAWSRAFTRYANAGLGELIRPWMETFAPAGRPPRTGELVRLPDHAATLRALASGGADEFYCGSIAERVDRHARETGGALRAADLAAYAPLEAPPLRVRFAGHEVWELPPNGQGIVALLALALLERRESTGAEPARALGAGTDPSARAHEAIEAVKLAFRECRPRVGDPARSARCAEELLDPAFVEKLAAEMGGQASRPEEARPDKGGTVYLAAASEGGSGPAGTGPSGLTMVSLIQSNYMGFGSGIVVPGTGVTLQNRGACFSLDPGHPNALGPGRRSYHTIIPGFLTRGGLPLGPFGVMGGFMQPQGHVQVLDRLLREGHNPQAALDAPRWQWVAGRRLIAEQSCPRELLAGLAERGHEVAVSLEDGEFGRGQFILRTEEGAFCAGTEPRSDSLAAGL